jgi:CubicO group peptidase (beta-lactamase class C family)
MKRILGPILLAILLVFSAGAQSALPDTLPGRLLQAWLASLAFGDLARHTTFLHDHASPDARHGMSPDDAAARDMDFRQRVGGGFDVLKVIESSSTDIRVLLKERSSVGFAEAELHVNPANPEVIAAMGVRRVPPPAEALPSREEQNDLIRDVGALVDQLAAKDQFSGVVIIARDGRPLFVKACGFADRDAKVPNREDTKFALGSMNKMFTAVAVAQLVEQGKFQFTDTLVRVLPDYPNHEVASKITVEQLLTHTSGLGDFFGPGFHAKANSLKELKDYLPLFVDQPLKFEPGSKWAYSNAGFIVLGLIVERSSGQNYLDYVRQHIYKEAGMQASDSYAKAEHVPNEATGYMSDDSGGLVRNDDTLPLRGTSAGGGYSTAPDLVKFAQALRSHHLLNAGMTDRLTTGKVDTGKGDKYGFGFQETMVGGHRVVGHNGGAPGMNSVFDVYWDSGYAVVVLSNFDPPAAENVALHIRQRILP